MIRTTGQWLGRMQRIARELRAEFEREAHTQEFKALNREFLEEDRRLKELARSNPLAAPTSRDAALEQAAALQTPTTVAEPVSPAASTVDAVAQTSAHTTPGVTATKVDDPA
jgi:Sec-independent protein translocase protein TatA